MFSKEVESIGNPAGIGKGTGFGLRERDRDGIGLGHYRLRATSNRGIISLTKDRHKMELVEHFDNRIKLVLSW